MDKKDPVAQFYKVDAQTHQKFEDLRKLNLKHPGMVAAPIRRLLARDSWDEVQLSKIGIEWWKHFGKGSK